MPKYSVSVDFDRLNSKGKLERSNRDWEFSAVSAEEAKKKSLRMLIEDEPTRRKIYGVTVVRVNSK